MNEIDTIIALATPSGRGSISVLRISGPRTIYVAQEILGKKILKPRFAEYCSFLDCDGRLLDQGIALFFPSPYSFTGEDVLELQGHGSPIIIDLLIKRILSISGIRMARPGEFSERAFLNNKIDLLQAEAIADMIEADSIQSARAALLSFQGNFSININNLINRLEDLRSYVEWIIDFSESEIDLSYDTKIEETLNNLLYEISSIQIEANQSNLLRKGMKFVIVGKPNSGKSSLLNALVGNEAAIVTNIAGTTRDILHESIYLDGIPIHIIDTAGIRKTKNKIEHIGIKKTLLELNKADHLLYIIDNKILTYQAEKIQKIWSYSFSIPFPTKIPMTVIYNKSDLYNRHIEFHKKENMSFITLSSKTKDGIHILLEYLRTLSKEHTSTSNRFLARQRHLDILKNALNHLTHGKKLLHSNNWELFAEELKLAQCALNAITGKNSSSEDDLLAKIFSSFCVGK
ncbi:tRNA uridine-5-carboxymethylaminomethyl(34) synthesis GTPase MnmE [Candidatus Schneideria nysicola]|uniref:tRNA uridine-5-carboxymethylaminomethyl(34) synthesis GTPase MnmE n=1 Tax=Candidatus Schneideria nysicola TaxID=1081631 RepID=UPI001CAA646E|nr:tRNA uridine-5-carboxymethylaminomethyl(34) synthesis GTPase MnmE [Candidatus Schneideria nysicola]UAJ65863.1 tRNA uridine-5-carboxymethylaminomethyl(34) synthesis GTPase MnmE [Candidatus Schneideria nysicola]